MNNSNEPAFSLIIPSYNEEAVIQSVIESVLSLQLRCELIVVDDGSDDKTAEIAETCGAKVISHPVNRGYGAALKTGIKNSLHDIIVIMDADGTYPHDSIRALTDIFVAGKLDMVVGARTKPGAAIPLIRRPAKWVLKKLATVLTRSMIPDLNSGLRVFKKETLEKYLGILPDGFSFTTTITIAMLSNGHAVAYEPVDYYKRTGKSKIRPFYDTLNFVILILTTVLLFNPLRVFVPFSLAFIGGGLMILIYQLIDQRNISDFTVIIVFSGIQLLAIGVLADLIGKHSK